MNGPSTNINDIVNDNKRLSNEEADMVDSIINDLMSIFKKSKQKRDNKKNNDVDLVLEKISKSGYESLNEKEKELLFKSSKKWLKII